MRPPLAGFVQVPADPARLWVRAGLEAAAPSLLAAWAGDAEEWIGGGRAPHPVIELPDGGRAVVRRYLRGGAVRHLTADRYFLGDRARAEAGILEMARGAGLRVPEVVAFGRRRARPGYRAMLATRRVAQARDGAAALRDDAAREPFLARLGAALARMHEVGIAHPDLNLRNALQDEHGAVWLIDFDRATCSSAEASPSARSSNLLRLARSAAKLGVPLSAADREALRAGYGPRWPARLR